MLVSASFLSNEFKPIDLIKEFEKSQIDFLHVDIMDGKFLKQKTYTFGEIKKFTKYITKKLDVHLMVKNPMKYIEDYALLNVEYITFHYESVTNPEEIINCIKNLGIKVGMSIKPKTKVSKIFPYLKELDLVLIMSVEPGKSGQAFMESIFYKIEALNKKINEDNLKTLISVDGGINKETGIFVKEKGADILISASFLHNGNIIENVKTLKNI